MARHAQILDMFQVFALILATRLMLLLTLAGAFVLALQAMEHQTYPAIIVLICYAVLIIAPLIYLEIRARPRAQG